VKYLLVLMFLSILSCATSNHLLTEDQKNELLYKEKCSGCHRLYSKEEFAKDIWIKTLPVMKTKSKLTEQEYLSIKDFLLNDSP